VLGIKHKGFGEKFQERHLAASLYTYTHPCKIFSCGLNRDATFFLWEGLSTLGNYIGDTCLHWHMHTLKSAIKILLNMIP
jgi:hypothetical protein